jgi:hypothetical protein
MEQQAEFIKPAKKRGFTLAEWAEDQKKEEVWREERDERERRELLMEEDYVDGELVTVNLMDDSEHHRRLSGNKHRKLSVVDTTSNLANANFNFRDRGLKVSRQLRASMARVDRASQEWTPRIMVSLRRMLYR